jgi:hypothetical protein
MKGFENQAYLIAYIISNTIAVLLVWLAWKQPKAARVLFILLFSWACWINWKTALQTPRVYLEYGEMAILEPYKQFIQGWFSKHILLIVSGIATCQGLIAIALAMKGRVYKAGCIGAIIFLLAIMPLGVGSAFPSTLVGAVALAVLFRSQHSLVWQSEKDAHSYTIAAD